MTGGAQYRQQVPDAGEPGSQVPARSPDRGHEVLRRGGPQVVGDQVHVQGEDVGGLSAGGNLAVRGHERVGERRADLRPQGPVASGVVRPAGGVGDLGHQRRVMRPVGGGEQFVRGVVVARGEPVVVAVAEPRGPQVVGVGPLEEVHPPGHGAEVPVQDRGVAVHLPHRPRDDHPGVGPGRRPGSDAGEPRRDVGEGAGGQLGVAKAFIPAEQLMYVITR